MRYRGCQRCFAPALTIGVGRTYDRALVNPDALPYTSIILLVELAVGTLGVVTFFDARRMVTMGYLQMCALAAAPRTLLAGLFARGLDPRYASSG